MKIKRILKTFILSTLTICIFATSVSAATTKKMDLSKSYEEKWGYAICGYDIGSIFPYDDVWGWTNSYVKYW